MEGMGKDVPNLMEVSYAACLRAMLLTSCYTCFDWLILTVCTIIMLNILNTCLQKTTDLLLIWIRWQLSHGKMVFAKFGAIGL